MNNEHISIVLVCDDFYAILLAAFLKSIEVNHHTDEQVDVYIIDDHISVHNRQKIVDSLESNGKLTLNWIKMTEAIPKNAKLPLVHNAYPLNILVRLFIPHFIPSQIRRIIYFDVDMIMLGDISELWRIDIGDSIVGAISDTIGPVEKKIGNGIENHLELGLDPDLNYFNSGLLVINVAKWKESEITQRTLDVIENNRKYAVLSDQYGLNVVLAGRWFEIDPTWSCFSINTTPSPKLIHYFYIKPIFRAYTYNYRDEFYHYLNLTQWKGFKPISEVSRYIKKVRNFLQKLKFKFQ